MRTSALALGLAAALLSPPAGAELTQLHRVDLRTNARRDAAHYASAAAEALLAGRDPSVALELAGRGIEAYSRNPWPHYQKAEALLALRRVDDAVHAFRDAEARFEDGDPWGRSVAIYGRARALEGAGRCPEAAASFEDYARFVARYDASAAAKARARSLACGRPPVPRPKAPH